MRREAWILGCLFLALNACERRPPTPTPPVVLPVVVRATLTLQTPADLDAHGDVVIPMDAIVRRGGIPGVFVLSDHGLARFRLVKIGTTTTEKAQILSGLSGDETLVLPPFQDVYDGSPVRSDKQP
ncbi:MAG TPA: hypothetical protein VMV40_04185 [Acidiferrobacter sp.]|nr:hypothetical protein [Acidiferrobacter sp.]